jgi:hypothetical protein
LPEIQNPDPIPEPIIMNWHGLGSGGGSGCYLDGFEMPNCNLVNSLLENGSAVIAPLQTVAGIYSTSQNRFVGLAVWNPNQAAAGISWNMGGGSLPVGWAPVGINFVGNGFNVYGSFMSLGYLLEMHGATRGVPQKSFSECFKEAGLDKKPEKDSRNKAAQFNEKAAKLIQEIFIREFGIVSQAALAVTLMNEDESFALENAETNFNNKPSEVMKWDLGPFQLNVFWTNQAVLINEVSLSGLTYDGIFGSTFFDKDNKPIKTFTGNPLQNGQMAARRLNAAPGKTEKEKVTNYTAPASRGDRANSYDWYAPKFKTFFDCFHVKGLM